MKAVKIAIECPSCGNIIRRDCPIVLSGKGFEIHTGNVSCGCGRQSKFSLSELVLIDVIEDKPLVSKKKTKVKK